MHARSRHTVTDKWQWVLSSPAHYSEVAKAVAVATREREQAVKLRKLTPGDVMISARDDEVIVWFEAERPDNPMRRGARTGGLDIATELAEAGEDRA